MAFKLITFVIGLVTLIYGSITLGIRDWDIGVSVLLATYTLAKPIHQPMAAPLAGATV